MFARKLLGSPKKVRDELRFQRGRYGYVEILTWKHINSHEIEVWYL